MSHRLRNSLIALVIVLAAIFAGLWWMVTPRTAQHTPQELSGPKPVIAEERPETIPSVATARPIGWKPGETPTAAQGLKVALFADGLVHPRSMLALPNGDVLVAETNGPAVRMTGDIGLWGRIQGLVQGFLFRRVGAGVESPNRIALLRDADGDGKPEFRSELIGGLNSPFGMALVGDTLFIGNTDGVVSVPFKLGDTKITATPTKLFPLPGGGNHWARNLLASPDGKFLYITVGSSSNIADFGIEAEKGRAAIYEYNLATKELRQFAGGLRNPNGMAFNPNSGELWTVVNERDQLGVDLVPDYLTNVPVGAQYGWPWVYWKDHVDHRVTAPIPNYLTEYTRRPEYALGAHMAPLGLVFTDKTNHLGPQFASGAFIARHGSWNRSPLTGYDVVYVAFDNLGNVLPNKPVEVLTGFLAGQDSTRGRPVWLQWDKTGALLVSDDVGNAVWRVTTAAPAAAPAATPASGQSAPPAR